MSHIRRDTRSTNCNQLYTPNPNYTEANSQSNTDFGVHFFVFIFIQINVLDKKNRQ